MKARHLVSDVARWHSWWRRNNDRHDPSQDHEISLAWCDSVGFLGEAARGHRDRYYQPEPYWL